MLPSLRDRYSTAELLPRATSFILRDGFAGAPFITQDEDRRKYLMSRLNSALGHYDLEVVRQEEPAPPSQQPQNPRDRLRVVK